MTKIDILGASPATLSMIFELVHVRYRNEEVKLRIIKNADNALNIPFAIEGITYQVIDTKDTTTLNKKICLGVYKAETKRIVYEEFSKGFDMSHTNIISLIHNQSALAASVEIGDGVQINPMSTIGPYAHIEDFVSINRNVSIGHHTRIAQYCTLNPGVHVAGHCELGEGVTVGMGALILDGKKIGKGSMIAAGALVTKDIPENVLVMGSPAKIMKQL